MADTPLTFVHIVVLALLQGITEFLPISSSAHLILVPVVTGWPDQGTEMDVAVHVGTLGAVLIYFRRDVIDILGGIANGLQGRRSSATDLALKLLVATLPLLLVGAVLVLSGAVKLLRQPEVIAWATVLLALLLYFVDRRAPTSRDIPALSFRGALLIGLMQVLALVPGASRAGVSITGARLLGIERTDAARFSMLLSIPAILAAGGYAGFELAANGSSSLGWQALIAAALAFLAALASIAFLMRWVRTASYTPFVVYRLVLGAVLLWWVYGV